MHIDDKMIYAFSISENKLSYDFILLKNTIRYSPGFMYLKDKNSVYLMCNENFSKVAGLKNPEEIAGKTDFDLAWSDTESELFIKGDVEVLSGKAKINFEESQKQADGKTRIVLANKVPMYDEKNNIIGILGNYVDITDRKELENDLIETKVQAQVANKVKTAFLANMSHDIRTPLTGIISMSEVLMADVNLRTMENVKAIYESSVHLLNMLNQILDFIQSESVGFRDLQKVEIFSIREIVKDVLALYKAKSKTKNLLLLSEISKDVPNYIKTKPTFIHKILVNLVGNALKFTDSGYVKIAVWLDENLSNLSFSVSDTGKGIPDDKKETVFEWFEKLTPSYKGYEHGTGLGLATVKNAIEALNGNINITDNEGGGTIFTCKIPIEIIYAENDVTPEYASDNIFDKESLRATNVISSSSKSIKSRTESISANKPIVGKRLLLIEDSATAGKGTSIMLKKAGFLVHWVETGGEGLSEILHGNYDIVISDIGLPDMEGDEVVLRAREKGIITPIYALTGYADINKEALIEKGFTEVMKKPLSIELFLDLMQQHSQQKN